MQACDAERSLRECFVAAELRRTLFRAPLTRRVALKHARDTRHTSRLQRCETPPADTLSLEDRTARKYAILNVHSTASHEQMLWTTAGLPSRNSSGCLSTSSIVGDQSTSRRTINNNTTAVARSKSSALGKSQNLRESNNGVKCDRRL